MGHMQGLGKEINRREWFASAVAASAMAAPVRLPHKIRVAVIGQEGHLGELLSPLPQLPDVEVVAYCDANAAALASLGKKVKNVEITSAQTSVSTEGLNNSLYFYQIADRNNFIISTGKFSVKK